MNLDAADALREKRHLRERGGDLGGEPLTDAIDADPIADLDGRGADARVKAGAAEHLALFEIEDAERLITTEVELAAEAPEQADALVERQRLVVRPGQPRTQVIEARVDRCGDERRIGGGETSDHQSRSHDAIGSTERHDRSQNGSAPMVNRARASAA